PVRGIQPHRVSEPDDPMQRQRSPLSYRWRAAASGQEKRPGQGTPGLQPWARQRHHGDNRPGKTPMQLISFERAGRAGYGAVKDGGVVDLGARLGREASTLIDLIANGLEARAAEMVAREAPDFSLEDVTLDLPLPRPGKILCIGINYLDRN